MRSPYMPRKVQDFIDRPDMVTDESVSEILEQVVELAKDDKLTGLIIVTLQLEDDGVRVQGTVTPNTLPLSMVMAALDAVAQNLRRDIMDDTGAGHA